MFRCIFLFVLYSIFACSAEAQTPPPPPPCAMESTIPVCIIIAAPSGGETTQIAGGYYTYAWNYTASGSNTLQLESCNSATTNTPIVFKDEYGGAGINPIEVFTAGTNTIEKTGYPTALPPLTLLHTPFQSATLQCDGNGNWMLE